MAAKNRERGKAGERREGTRALLAQEPRGLASGEVARRLDISRQAAFAHLTALVDEGRVERVGRGRGTRYRLKSAAGEVAASDATSPSLERRITPEDDAAVLGESASFREMSPAASELFAEAMRRMLTLARARDPHGLLDWRMEDGPKTLCLELVDAGEVLFAWARRQLGLRTAEEARLLLSKGLGDTDLRWLTRAADVLEIEGGALGWRVDNLRADQSLYALDPPRSGTRMRFCADPLRPMNVDALEHDRDAHALVRLFDDGEVFPSRQQARELMQGLELCERVVLDFGGVQQVGEAFADEIFRVWSETHAQVRLHPIRMRACVAEAIVRVRRDH